jgi:peroxiredoxin
MRVIYSSLFFLLIASCSTYLWDSLQKPSQSINAVTVEGKSLAIPTKNKATIIHFWSYNHPLSRNSLVYFNKIQEEASKKGAELRVVCLNWSGSAVEIQEYLRKNNFTFPVVFDTDGKIAQSYEVTSVPQTQIIQSNGTITHRLMGLREDVNYVDEIVGKIGAK